jgi:hypothetical protein
MTLAEIYEGMMKRSDPYISGEKDGPRPVSHPAVGNVKKTGTTHSQKIEALARKGKVQPSKAQQVWEEERDKIDHNHPNRWALVMTNVKKRLGIT